MLVAWPHHFVYEANSCDSLEYSVPTKRSRTHNRSENKIATKEAEKQTAKRNNTRRDETPNESASAEMEVARNILHTKRKSRMMSKMCVKPLLSR